MIINGVEYEYYENPCKIIEEQQEIITELSRELKALRESETFYKNNVIELAEILGCF